PGAMSKITELHATYYHDNRNLDTARSLYESEGFIRSKEINAHQWGIDLTEQMFTLRLGE
ncbi:MAG: hypothetical protein U9R24_07530, partial [Thermodesulfobacteriota bacterium]|nr:hypothetical protein [Thermodesulfobacteriota bacterium]